MEVPARRQRAATDNGFPVSVPARCREYGNGNYEAPRPFSTVADMSSHTSWSAMGHERTLQPSFGAREGGVTFNSKPPTGRAEVLSISKVASTPAVGELSEI
jgi:hypothetical protein